MAKEKDANKSSFRWPIWSENHTEEKGAAVDYLPERQKYSNTVGRVSKW